MKRILRALPAVLVLAVLIAVWEVYVDTGGVDSLILPSPHQVARALYQDRSLLWSNFLVTAREVLLGILVAMAAGVLLAIAIHLARPIRLSVYPLVIGSQAIPIVMLAPVLTFWLGFGILPKLVVIALVSFFPIVVTTLDALAAVDADLLKLMHTFDASRLRTFRQIELPAMLPGLFTGAKIAAAVAVIGAVFAEWTGSTSGLGYLFLQSIPQLLAARGVAAVTVLFLFAISLFGLLTVAERRVVPWAHQSEGERS